MSEYIRRNEAAVVVLSALVGKFYGFEIESVMEEVEAGFNALTAATDTPVVHGEWVVTNPKEPEMPVYECSACNHVGCVKAKLNYCPNCGAKMDGGEL